MKQNDKYKPLPASQMCGFIIILFFYDYKCSTIYTTVQIATEEGGFMANTCFTDDQRKMLQPSASASKH